jgi:hypothetical protein
MINKHILDDIPVFGSPLAQRDRHPYAKQAVEHELELRGSTESLHCCNEWIDKYWYSFYDMQRATDWAGIQEVKRPV